MERTETARHHQELAPLEKVSESLCKSLFHENLLAQSSDLGELHLKNTHAGVLSKKKRRPSLDAALVRDLEYKFPSIFFILAMTSVGWLITSLTIFSSSSPCTGSRSNCRLSISVRNSGSFMVALNASRKILMRSAGMPGVPIIGLPSWPEASISVARRRLGSSVL